MSELQEVVDELQRLATPLSKGGAHRGMMEARRALKVIRELAEDFDKYADHTHTCEAVSGGPYVPEWCNCGYPERVEKWRLE